MWGGYSSRYWRTCATTRRDDEVGSETWYLTCRLPCRRDSPAALCCPSGDWLSFGWLLGSVLASCDPFPPAAAAAAWRGLGRVPIAGWRYDGVGPDRGLRGKDDDEIVHIISVRPSKQPLMVRTFFKVYMELGSYFWFLQKKKRHHHHQGGDLFSLGFLSFGNEPLWNNN